MGRHFKTYSHSLIDVDLANSHSRSSSSSTATTTLNSASYIPVTTSLLSSTTPLRLAPRDEPTRVQLQKQRLREQHVKAPVSAAIPGFKTSAAFFGSLRTNLRLHASPPPSPLSTPNSMQGSTASLPPPSPLSQPALSAMDNVDVPAAEDPLAGVPELTSYLTTDEEERVEALKLVADSVAQQRQLANKALIYSPLNLAILVGIVAQAARYMLDKKVDHFVVLTVCMGIIMTFMAGTRFATKDYLFAAEEINWEWVGDSDFLVTKFGEEVIGTAVIEWVSGESRQKRKKAWRGFIKAWTVKRKYRGKGVGSALLEDAIKEAKKKNAEGLEFDDLHANSKRVLPTFYNSGFDKRDRKARELLEDLKQSSPGGGKRK